MDQSCGHRIGNSRVHVVETSSMKEAYGVARQESKDKESNYEIWHGYGCKRSSAQGGTGENKHTEMKRSKREDEARSLGKMCI